MLVSRWAIAAALSCALGCSSEPASPGASAGAGSAPLPSAAAGGGGNGGDASTASGASTTPSSGGASAGAGGTPSASGGSANAGSGGSATAASGSAGVAGAGGNSNPKRVLLYYFGTLSIPSVPMQLSLLEQQLEAWGYQAETSLKPEDLHAANLARFTAVGMINTCFEPFGKGQLGAAQTTALTEFVEAGGGLFGTHCAAVTFQAIEPPHAYNALIGGRGGHGYFDGKSQCRTTLSHPSTVGLPTSFEFEGNLDNADYLASDAQVLVKCQWSGGDKKDTAVSWLRTPAKGRVFYTNFAKLAADLSDANLGAMHILPGLAWVLGR